MVENQINFKLRYMLACSDEEFNLKVKDKLDRRRRFESGFLNDAQNDSQTINNLPEYKEVVECSGNENSYSEPEDDFPESDDSNSDVEDGNRVP